MAKNVGDLAASLHRAAKSTERVNKGAVTTAAAASKTIVAGAMVSTGVTPGKKLKVGGKVSPFYNVKGNGSDVTAIIGLRGPAQIVNNPTTPHRIGPRGRGGRRRGGKKALTIGSNVRAYANHPGTRGKHFWEAAEKQMRKRIPDVVQQAHRSNWLREFGG